MSKNMTAWQEFQVRPGATHLRYREVKGCYGEARSGTANALHLFAADLAVLIEHLPAASPTFVRTHHSHLLQLLH